MNRAPQFSKILIAATGLLGISITAAGQRTANLARARDLVQSGIEAARTGHASSAAKFASTVSFGDFTNLVEHDADSRFRYEALMQLGDLVSPPQTLPALSRIARKEPKTMPGRAALFAIYQSVLEGKLKARMKEVEQLAIDCLGYSPQNIWAVKILGLCHTHRSMKMLQAIATGKDTIMKSIALEALAQKSK